MTINVVLAFFDNIQLAKPTNRVKVPVKKMIIKAITFKITLWKQPLIKVFWDGMHVQSDTVSTVAVEASWVSLPNKALHRCVLCVQNACGVLYVAFRLLLHQLRFLTCFARLKRCLTLCLVILVVTVLECLPKALRSWHYFLFAIHLRWVIRSSMLFALFSNASSRTLLLIITISSIRYFMVVRFCVSKTILKHSF